MEQNGGLYKNKIWILVVAMITTVVVLLIGYLVFMVDKQVSKEESTPNVMGQSEFIPVYGADEQLMNTEVNFYIKLSPQMSLMDKLKNIAGDLSRFKFYDLPIEVVSIEEEEGKKIAVINLKEHPENQGMTEPPAKTGNLGMTWRYNHFQGSTGGGFTTDALVMTFLQKDYPGEWVDGVRFLYENKPMGEWDHVFISGTIYRKDIGK